MPLSDLLLDQHVLRFMLFEEGLQTDEYIPQLDVMKFVSAGGVIQKLSRKYGIDQESIQAYRLLHEMFHKLLSLLTASYWLYCLELRSSGAFGEAAHLASTKSNEETIARLRELKEIILLCEASAGMMQSSIELLHEAFIALALRDFGRTDRERETFERIGKTYIAQIAEKGAVKDVIELYKKMRWLMNRCGKDFLVEIVKASLNIPVINFQLMDVRELEILLKSQPYRFSPLRRFQKIVQVLQEEPARIRTVEDLSKRLWALGLTEEMPVKLQPLATVGFPKNVGLCLAQRPYDSFRLMSYLPYWDFYGANIAYDPQVHITYNELLELPESAVRLTEGEDLYFRYGRKRSKTWSDHCYVWETRDDLKGLDGYLHYRFIELVLKDQTVALTIKKYENRIPKLERIKCLNKEFQNCFYGNANKQDGYTVYKEKTCTACEFYPLMKGAQKLCSIFLEIPTTFE